MGEQFEEEEKRDTRFVKIEFGNTHEEVDNA